MAFLSEWSGDQHTRRRRLCIIDFFPSPFIFFSSSSFLLPFFHFISFHAPFAVSSFFPNRCVFFALLHGGARACFLLDFLSFIAHKTHIRRSFIGVAGEREAAAGGYV